MCPHFETDAKKCGLCNQNEWANLCSSFGLDFIVNDYCKAEAYSSGSGADNTGFKNCGQYKLNERS